MRYKCRTHHEDVSYDVLAEKSSETRMYKLLRLSLTKTSNEVRKKILDDILHEEKTIGTIEWWTRGSIVHKPKAKFDIVIISRM